ncbi:MAG: hypothetical protein JF887_00455 [Candidatus Dormibacteraeota bacterium]|uniref:Uncharacterized protein n=1 Tax=Candidatus Amunia macphersoniae TaxID=3127014 RepID=A0A934KL94_9BACT|nr:hypothetical protein [Candidatus Dormibacteraeota bacterium]
MSTTPEYPSAAEPLPPAQPLAPAPVTTDPRVAAIPTSETTAERYRRELNRFRGLNFGAAFFGWLVGVGMAALLTAILSAAGAALTLTQNALSSTSTATTLTLAGVILFVVILLLSYYSGGYVAGRLSRFSGAVQGFGVWVIGLLVTVALAVAGVVAGSKYNVLAQLRLPSIPVNGQSFATGGVIVLVIVALLTLLAAIGGGIAGLRYQHRVDRALSKV